MLLDWAKLFVAFTTSLCQTVLWPVISMILLFVFRDEIVKILTAISSGKLSIKTPVAELNQVNVEVATIEEIKKADTKKEEDSSKNNTSDSLSEIQAISDQDGDKVGEFFSKIRQIAITKGHILNISRGIKIEKQGRGKPKIVDLLINGQKGNKKYAILVDVLPTTTKQRILLGVASLDIAIIDYANYLSSRGEQVEIYAMISIPASSDLMSSDSEQVTLLKFNVKGEIVNREQWDNFATKLGLPLVEELAQPKPKAK